MLAFMLPDNYFKYILSVTKTFCIISTHKYSAIALLYIIYSSFM